jgi:hypothetical protein
MIEKTVVTAEYLDKALERAFDTFAIKVQEGFAGFEKRVSARFDTVDERFDEIDRELDIIKSHNFGLDNRMQNQEDHMRLVRTKLNLK